MLLEIWQDYRDESEKKSKGWGVHSTLIFILLNNSVRELVKGFQGFCKRKIQF